MFRRYMIVCWILFALLSVVGLAGGLAYSYHNSKLEHLESSEFATLADSVDLLDETQDAGPWKKYQKLDDAALEKLKRQALANAELRRRYRESRTAAGSRHGFVWSRRNGMLDLGTLGGEESFVFDINNRNQVSGDGPTAIGHLHAFRWAKRDGKVDLGTLGGLQSFDAVGINQRGWVVGQSALSGGIIRAFLWTERSGMIDLGTLGGLSSSACCINNQGQIAGMAALPVTGAHPFVWTKRAGMIDLGTIGGQVAAVTAMNNHGKVVGQSETDTGERHATLWELK